MSRRSRTGAIKKSKDGPEAERLQAADIQDFEVGARHKGGILAALRRSPLVGADVIAERPLEPGRKVRL